MWESRRLTNLWASTACYRNEFKDKFSYTLSVCLSVDIYSRVTEEIAMKFSMGEFYQHLYITILVKIKE
jgi:hypothetical protein